MAENRSVSRLNVAWHAAIRLPSKYIVQVKVSNITQVGLQFLCEENLQSGQKYEMQIHVPALNSAGAETLVPCFVECQYVILTGSDFRVGGKLSGLSKPHSDLLAKWSERCARGS